ncbi:aminotransferase class I/II-fold pyridoxal phosphate-dependent enzyme [Leptolyngbya sp. AN02str]|uniref:aminotransferase class I/II-fold pyridoxal phosphate-dependent enzyme n=1 Tax=Leptolyngbya sp. AN02str TaxID=3423363 RepID=UPI003D317E5D
MRNQQVAPLVAALRRSRDRPDAAFYAPGHKRGQGISPLMVELLGDRVFQADLPELPELDNLFAPEGAIAEAQALAAELFGATHTWFLVNGSTCGIEAAILATCQPGDKLILPRNCHQSAIAALVLSGAVPVFISPTVDDWGMAHSITPSQLAHTLAQHPDAKAVLLVYPTYYGTCGDIWAIAQIAHHYQIPLIVDEAHGAHFAFHPDLPMPSLEAGADIVIQSTHKVLGAMTQASMLHSQGNLIDPERIRRALAFVQSTSPSYLLLASLDAARYQMAQHGRSLMSQTLRLATWASDRLSATPGLAVFDPHTAPGCTAGDRTRLTVSVSNLGISGYKADDILREHLGVTCELPSLQTLTFIVSLGNTETDVECLVAGFTHLAAQLGDRPSTQVTAVSIPPLPQVQLSPREAFFAATETVSVEQSIGCVAAELVCPYPPGIPALVPGETITPQAIAHLLQVLALGGAITGCADPSLATIRVIQR